jgi:hypothetical protein
VGVPADVDEVARRILEYLDSCPNASDTFEGIAQWWLGAASLHVPAETVQRALDQLAHQRRLVAKRRIDGTTVYTRAPAFGADRNGG